MNSLEGFNIFTDIGSSIYNALHQNEVVQSGEGKQLTSEEIKILAASNPAYVPSLDTFFDSLTDSKNKLLMYVGIGIVLWLAGPALIGAFKKK